MKKIFAILTLATAGIAYAGSATVEYQSWEKPSTKTDTTGLRIAFQENLTNNLAGDISLSVNQKESSNILAGRADVGVTYTVPLGSVRGYVRGGTGVKFENGVSSHSYYSVEPGIGFRVTEKLSSRIGYRYRTAFSNSVNDETRTVRVSASYGLTKIDTVGVRFDRQRGDSEQNIVGLFYNRKF